MSYRKLDANGKMLPKNSRTGRKPATRRERSETLYHYEIVVAIPAPGGKWKSIRRRFWLPDDNAAEAKQREMKHETPSDALTWLEAYRLWLEANKSRFSPGHIENANTTIRQWTEAFGAKATVEGTGLAEMSGWLEERASKGAGRGAQIKRGHLLAIARWCRARGFVKSLPFEHAPKPHYAAKRRRPASVAEYHAIKDVLPEWMTYLWQILGLTGMRIAAACNLLESDITDTELTVTTKGNKRITYTITPEIAEVIAAARAFKGKTKAGSKIPTLFCNAKGARWNKGAFNNQLHRRLDAAGVPVVTAHQLRHMAGTLMAEDNLSPDIIQAGLGHDDRSSAETYIDQTRAMRDQALVSIVKKLSKNDIESASAHPKTASIADHKKSAHTCPCCGANILVINKKSRKPLGPAAYEILERAKGIEPS